jgi:hypothetical protein
MQFCKHYYMQLLLLLILLVMAFVPALQQDLTYHDFSDQRTLFGIPNFFNVLSSLPYLLIGLPAAMVLLISKRLVIIPALRPVYITFFVAVALVCLGSGYYHLQPSNASLVWDRLPMAIAFMAFVTIIVAEYLDENLARKLFIPLILIGVASVFYWYYSETLHQGDLRPYLLVQFLPIVFIPVILLTRTSRFSHGYYYWLVLGCYVLAKILEQTDAAVYESLMLISGHSLKHLVSALAPLFFYLALRNRRLLNVT